jgi:hypothetical protein
MSRAAAELQKLAHGLDVPVEQLEMLADLEPGDVRELRQQVSDALFEAGRPAFERVAALSKAIPGGVAAKLTQAVLPPLIAARVAEVLDPDRAADMVGRLSQTYVAEVAMRMDATRAPHVVDAIPAERIGATARELARREEWVVIGGFVSAVSPAALAASVAEFSGEQLLRIGFVLDDVSRFDEIGDLLTPPQLDGILTAAAASSLWAELAELVSHLTGPRLERLAARYAEAPASVRTAFEAAAAAGDLPSGTLGALAG